MVFWGGRHIWIDVDDGVVIEFLYIHVITRTTFDTDDTDHRSKIGEKKENGEKRPNRNVVSFYVSLEKKAIPAFHSFYNCLSFGPIPYKVGNGSDLVGVNTTAQTPKGSLLILCKIGRANARVFPLPV